MRQILARGGWRSMRVWRFFNVLDMRFYIIVSYLPHFGID